MLLLINKKEVGIKKEEVKKLQEELIGIISCIPASSNDSVDKDRALEIIGSLGHGHINDIILYNSKKGTILDFIIEFDSQPGHTVTLVNNILTQSDYRIRLNNKTLVELEKSVKGFGGKKSEDLRGLLDRIASKAKHGANIGIFAMSAVLIVIGVIVGMMLTVVGAMIGIGAEIKTGANLLGLLI